MRIEPPRPPSPPSGPPRGMKGSRRNEAEPRPPCPARTVMRAESTKVRERPLFGDDADPPAVLTHSLVANQALGQREQRVVAPESDAGARLDPGPPLANENLSGVHGLAGVDLHAKHLRLGVAPVAGRPTAFLVCHYLVSLSVFAFFGARFADASDSAFTSSA